MMADHFADHEIEEFLRKIRVQPGILGQPSQPCDLCLLARRIGGGQMVQRLILADRLGAFEPFGKKVNQRGIEIVDAISQPQQFRIGHARLPLFLAACFGDMA
jgi:hypothetical protein